MGLRRYSNLLDVVLVLVGLVVGVIGLIIVYSDTGRFRIAGSDALGEPPVFAKIVEKQNVVKRKVATMPIWSEIEEAEVLYESDKIFSEKGATATIQFVDGSAIKVGENSLLVLQRKDNTSEIELKKGTLFAKVKSKDSSVQIKVGEVRTQIKSENAQLQIKSKVDGTADITVLEGKAETLVQGSVVQVEKNKRFEILADGSITDPKPLAFQLKSPERDETIFTEEGTGVVFQWNHLSEVKEVEFELSLDSEFRKILKNKKVTKDQIAINGLSSGTYYWRIASYNASTKTKEFSEERPLMVMENRAVKLLNPPHNGILEFNEEIVTDGGKSDHNGVRVFFHWEEIAQIDHYWVEIASSSDFSSILKREQTTKSSFDIFLTEGSYHWRVGYASAARRTEKVSLGFRFQVNKNSLPGVPTELSPENGKALTLYEAHEPVKLSWNPVNGAKTYEVEVSLNSEMKDNNQKKIVTQPWLQWQPEGAQDLYWRVRVVDVLERATKVSSIHKVSFALPPPPSGLKPENDFAVTVDNEIPSVTLNWEASASNSKYLVEWGPNEKFDKINQEGSLFKQQEVLENSTSIRVEPLGDIYWRIRVKDPFGRPTEPSRIHRISVNLTPPEIQGPRQIASIRVIPKPEPINFSWSGKGLAQKYAIQIARDEQFKEIVHQAEVNEPKYQWVTPQEGDLHWRVQAYLKNEKRTPYSVAALKVSRYAIPQPPVLDSIMEVELVVDEE